MKSRYALFIAETSPSPAQYTVRSQSTGPVVGFAAREVAHSPEPRPDPATYSPKDASKPLAPQYTMVRHQN
jgi:hypothetical protein